MDKYQENLYRRRLVVLTTMSLQTKANKNGYLIDCFDNCDEIYETVENTDLSGTEIEDEFDCIDDEKLYNLAYELAMNLYEKLEKKKKLF